MCTSLRAPSSVCRTDQLNQKHLVGHFANEVGFRIDCSETPASPPFVELLLRARWKVLDGYAHQHMLLHKVVDAPEVPRSPGTPMYRAMFALQGNSWKELDVQMHSAVKVSIRAVRTHSSKFQIHLQFRKCEDGSMFCFLHKSPCSAARIRLTYQSFTWLSRDITANMADEHRSVFRPNEKVPPSLAAPPGASCTAVLRK